jgi:hypothetical protein
MAGIRGGGPNPSSGGSGAHAWNLQGWAAQMVGGERGGRRRASGWRGEHTCAKGTAGGEGDGGARGAAAWAVRV